MSWLHTNYWAGVRVIKVESHFCHFICLFYFANLMLILTISKPFSKAAFTIACAFFIICFFLLIGLCIGWTQCPLCEFRWVCHYVRYLDPTLCLTCLFILTGLCIGWAQCPMREHRRVCHHAWSLRKRNLHWRPRKLYL